MWFAYPCWEGGFNIPQTWDITTAKHSPPFTIHDDVMTRKPFPHHWHFVRGIHLSPVDSLTKGEWCWALMLIWCWPEQTVEETVKLPMIWGAITLIWHCCNINSLWPSDAIWRQRTRSTLVQVLACCLTAPSLNLKQCRVTISPMAFIWGHYLKKISRYQSIKQDWK